MASIPTISGEDRRPIASDMTEVDIVLNQDDGSLYARLADGNIVPVNMRHLSEVVGSYAVARNNPGDINGGQLRLLGIERFVVTDNRDPRAGQMLKYDAKTTSFTATKTLTGTNSDATAEIESVQDFGTTGILRLTEVNGTFEDNEPITDNAGGAATADGVVTRLALVQITGTDAGYVILVEDELNDETFLAISSTGNVGIGEYDPTRKLVLRSASGSDVQLSLRVGDDTSVSALLLGDLSNDARGQVRYDNTNDDLELWAAGGVRAYARGNGAFGLAPRASEPASLSEGDAWMRQDGDQTEGGAVMAFLGGRNRALSLPAHPGVIANRYYCSPLVEPSAATGAVVANRLYLQPILLPGSQVDRFSINITGAAVGNCRVGLYAHDGSGPSDLILDIGTFSTNSVAIATASFTARNLPNDWLWMACVFDATPTVTTGGTVNTDLIGFTSFTAANRGIYGSHTYGNLPDPAAAITGVTSIVPMMTLWKS